MVDLSSLFSNNLRLKIPELKRRMKFMLIMKNYEKVSLNS